jgi:hypothetical protein
MEKSSELPAVAEPWFLAFKSKQDLAEATPGIDRAVKAYGKAA